MSRRKERREGEGAHRYPHNRTGVGRSAYRTAGVDGRPSRSGTPDVLQQKPGCTGAAVKDEAPNAWRSFPAARKTGQAHLTGLWSTQDRRASAPVPSKRARGSADARCEIQLHRKESICGISYTMTRRKK